MSEYYLIKDKSVSSFRCKYNQIQGNSLFLLKERASLHDVTNKRLCIVVRNSSGIDKFYILVLTNLTCKLTVTQNYRAFGFSCFVYMGQQRGLSSLSSLHGVYEETAEKKTTCWPWSLWKARE